MNTALLLGAVLLLLALADSTVRRLPLSPALLYLGIGWAAGAWLGAPAPGDLVRLAPDGLIAIELAVLVSLVAVGLRLQVPPTWRAWKVALMLAGPGMVVTILLGAAAAHWVLDLPWAAALLLAAILAPTDPVLASEVQIRGEQDRDAVRLSLSAEGGLNDGSALPGVMLGLGLLGLHEFGTGGARWWWGDLVLPIGGGVLLGVALGLGLGRVLRWRLGLGDGLARDELLFAGAVVFSFALAQAMAVSTFVVAFCVGVTLLMPLRRAVLAEPARSVGDRLNAFGERIERLIEAAMVLALGVALSGIGTTLAQWGFAAILVIAVRPLAVLAVIRRRSMPGHQRQMVAWFGIRGIGSLFYLAFAIEHGVEGELARTLVAATLASIALSIVLHGVSATPLMTRYQARRKLRPPPSAP